MKNDNHKNRLNIIDIPILLFFLLAPLSITFFEKQNLVIIALLSCIFIILNIKNIYKVKVEKIAFIFILSYLLYITISSIGMVFSLNKLNYQYLNNFLSRLITITTGIIILYIVSYWIARNPQKLKIIPNYLSIFALFSYYYHFIK